MSIRIGIVGAGKMGLSHFAIANAHPKATVVAVCDTSRYVLSVLKKFARVATYRDFEAMIDDAGLDAIIVATPTATHYRCTELALRRGLHVFVEKPLTLSPFESRALADLTEERRRVNQVGFHNRFIGTFREARRLVHAGALGTVTHVRGSAFGPAVVEAQATTWRSRRIRGRRLPQRLRLSRHRPHEVRGGPADPRHERLPRVGVLHGRRGRRSRHL